MLVKQTAKTKKSVFTTKIEAIDYANWSKIQQGNGYSVTINKIGKRGSYYYEVVEIYA